MNFFQWYQYVAPVLLVPLAYWLWACRYDGDPRLTWLAITPPVAFAYVVPAIGTNALRLWEFHTRLRLGRFRPHHGLVFGGAASVLALATLDAPQSIWSGPLALRSAFAVGSVLAFWNWLYDARAIRVGFITVYNRRYREAASPEAIAADYAPILFGGFGACYGVVLHVHEAWLRSASGWQVAWIAGCTHLACMVFPVLAYLARSRLCTGEWGLTRYEREPK